MVNTIRLNFNKINYKKRKEPDFIIIGVQKGGTTYLFDLLSQHNRVRAPIKKEIHFFDNNFDKGNKWYLSHFPLKSKAKNCITGEASPYYIFHPDAPKRIKKYLPLVKLIVLLRNPTERAYSHYQMALRNGNEKITDFEKAINNEKKRLENYNTTNSDIFSQAMKHQKFSYVSRGRYYEQIKRWFYYFDKEQFLFLTSEELFENEEKTLEKVFNFLNLKKVKIADKNLNKNKGLYSDMPNNCRKILNNYYVEENKKLENLLNKKFYWNNE